MAGEEAVPAGFGRAVQIPAAIFYADDGLLASLRLVRIQEVPEVLMGLFGRFGLRTNVDKLVDMTFQPCCTDARQSEVV